MRRTGRLREARFDPGVFSQGFYSYPEAARYLRVSPQTVASWTRGYVRIVHGANRRGDPAVRGIARHDDDRFVTFLDLVEMHFVKAFRDARIPLKIICEAAKRLQEQWQAPYPFASGKVDATHLRTLIAEASTGLWRTADAGQATFDFIEKFRLRIQFDRRTLAARMWFPLGPKRTVVLDPSRAFGAPIDKSSGVTTLALANAFNLEGQDEDRVADWYRVTQQAIRDAVEFETQFAG